MAYYGSQYQPYGTNLESGLSGLAPKRVIPKQRMRMSMKGMCAFIWFPWVLFSLLYADVTFSLHYNIPLLCWALVAVAAILALAIGTAAWQGLQESKPSWLLVLSFSTFLAVVLGPLLGDINYWMNMQPYYDLQTLNEYNEVNPATSQGQQMMDAGKVQFAQGTGLDLTKAFQFQDLDTYCVAPIAMGNSSLKSYDFWAVGLNCCGWNASKLVDYKCGQSTSSTAREGLRLMNANQRNYFRLAVQQAEAQYRITAKHPIFFYWTEDAAKDMLSYWDYGFKYFENGVGAFFVVQIFLVIVSTVLFSKFEF